MVANEMISSREGSSPVVSKSRAAKLTSLHRIEGSGIGVSAYARAAAEGDRVGVS